MARMVSNERAIQKMLCQPYPRPNMSELCSDCSLLWVQIAVPMLPATVDNPTVGALQNISTTKYQE